MSEERDIEVEKQIEKLGLNAPRVTKDHIDNLMSQVVYETFHIQETTLTIAISFLPLNGDYFQIAIGQSACSDIANFNQELANELAIEKCEQLTRDKLWEFEGYRLKWALHLNK